MKEGGCGLIKVTLRLSHYIQYFVQTANEFEMRHVKLRYLAFRSACRKHGVITERKKFSFSD
jgi:hypothetical protein